MEEKETKQKAKYSNHSIFVWIVVLFIAWTLGQYIFPEANGVFLENSFGISILAIIVGYILFIITYEVGKIIFGKISGYRLVYTNILMFTYKKNKDNKIKFSLGKFTHFGGKTIMAPKDDKANLTLYCLGGTIFTVFMNVLLIVVTNIIGNSVGFEEIIYFQYIMSAVSLLILIFQIVPFLSDEIYDGFILRICGSNKEIKKVYHQYLLQEEALLTDKDELIYINNNDLENHLLSRVGLYNCYYLLKNERVQEAYQEAINYLTNCQYLTEEETGKLYSIKYYFMILEGKEEQVNEEFSALEKHIRKIIANHNNYGTIKTALLVAVFIESSYDLYEYILGKIDKNKNKYYLSLQETEEKLIDHTLNYIEKKKVDWFRTEETEQ